MPPGSRLSTPGGQASFVGAQDELPDPGHDLVTYHQRVMNRPDDRDRPGYFVERVLVPEGLHPDEALRLWKTLPMDCETVEWETPSGPRSFRDQSRVARLRDKLARARKAADRAREKSTERLRKVSSLEKELESAREKNRILRDRNRRLAQKHGEKVARIVEAKDALEGDSS